MTNISEFNVIVTGEVREKLSVIASNHHCTINDLLADLIVTYVNMYDYQQSVQYN